MDRPEDRLALIELLDRDGRARRVVDVHRWPVTLGRALDNTVVLDDAQVAARHATLALDDLGRPCLQVGDSRNGVALGRRHLAAGTQLALPAGGALLQLGGQRLRLRLPGEALGDERALSPPVLTLPTLWALGITWVLMKAASNWVQMDPGTDLALWLPWLLTLLARLALWCGAWALGSKLFHQVFDFASHLAIVLPWLLVLELAELLLPAAAASLGWPLLWHLQKAALSALLLALVLRAHLIYLLPSRGRVITLGLASLLAGSLAVGVAVNQRVQGQLFSDPYMRTLPPSVLRLQRAEPTETLDAALLPLRETLAEQVREDAQDHPDDEGTP